MVDSRPILLTGAHRSGTTWMGAVLSSAPHVRYIHEPLNVDWPPPRAVFPARVRYWFTNIDSTNEPMFRRAYKHLLSSRFNAGAALVEGRFRGLKGIASHWLLHWQYRQNQSRVLVKDPFAVFSVDWLVNSFAFQPVILVRHPAGFVSSLMRLRFSFPFDHFLLQPSLMDRLKPFIGEIYDYSRNPRPIIDQGILLWKIIYSCVHEYRTAHPDWIVARHEDFSRDPIATYEGLFSRVGLPFSDASRSVIDDYSGSQNPIEPKSDIGTSETLKRNSIANVTNWKSRLDDRELMHIRMGVAEVATHFYSEEEW